MKQLRSLWSSEPALVTAFVVAVIEALSIPGDWQKVIFAALTLLSGGVIRSQVTPVGGGGQP